MAIMKAHKQLLTAAQLAELHERSVTWFYAHREELEAAGHPKRDPLHGGWWRPAVKEWLDNRVRASIGLVPQLPPPTDPYLASLDENQAA